MDNPVVDQLTKWVEREQRSAEHQQYINDGKQQAYQSMADRINQTCMECGEYFWSLERLAEHQEDKHPVEIEVPSYIS